MINSKSRSPRQLVCLFQKRKGKLINSPRRKGQSVIFFFAGVSFLLPGKKFKTWRGRRKKKEEPRHTRVQEAPSEFRFRPVWLKEFASLFVPSRKRERGRERRPLTRSLSDWKKNFKAQKFPVEKISSQCMFSQGRVSLYIRTCASLLSFFPPWENLFFPTLGNYVF